MVGLAAALTLLALTAHPTDARAGFNYEAALEGKTLVEGLGFEGVLTVYDETPRMYRQLGTPRTAPKLPLWYYFDQGAYAIVVRGEYREGRFFVKSIQYSGDKDSKIPTNSGIRLGDTLSKVVEAHGEADRIEGQDFVYEGRGVTFTVGSRSTVIGVTVYRPIVAPAPPAAPEAAAEPVVPAVIEKAVTAVTQRPMTLADLGVHVPLTPRWSPVGPLTATGGQFAASGGRVTLNVSVCRDCAFEFAMAVRSMDSLHGPNRVPEALRGVDPEALRRMNAELGYVGLYTAPAGAGPEWLIALRQGDRSVLFTVTVASQAALQPDVQRDIAAILAGVRLL